MSQPKTRNYEVFNHDSQTVPVKAWVRGVPIENEAKLQLSRVAQMPFIHKWVAAMPDVHLGRVGRTKCFS